MIIDVDVTSEFMGSGWIFMISGFWILLLWLGKWIVMSVEEVCVSHDWLFSNDLDFNVSGLIEDSILVLVFETIDPSERM